MAHSLGDASVQRYQVSGLHHEPPWKRPIIEEHPGPPFNLNIGRRVTLTLSQWIRLTIE